MRTLSKQRKRREHYRSGNDGMIDVPTLQYVQVSFRPRCLVDRKQLPLT